MQTRREKLIKALKVAIFALKNETTHYDWNNMSTCNCGVVAQAITGRRKEDIMSAFAPVFQDTAKRLKLEKGATWKQVVQQNCTITGTPLVDILKTLFSYGLTAEDVCHLEYLENPAILQRAKIEPTKDVITKRKEAQAVVLRKGVFGLGKKTKVVDVEITEKKRVLNYDKKHNLIKYLTAWAEILEEAPAPETTPPAKKTLTSKQEDLLRAVADENFEEAAQLRDEIATMAS